MGNDAAASELVHEVAVVHRWAARRSEPQRSLRATPQSDLLRIR